MSIPVAREEPTSFQFGDFTLDLRRHALYKKGQRVHLTSKPLQVLAYLVRNRGRAVEKRELLNDVWQGTFVTEDTLVQAIIEVRRCLGDNKADPHFIQTVHRHGYRFIAEVTEREAGGRHLVPVPKPTVAVTPRRSFRKLYLVLTAVVVSLVGVMSGLYLLKVRERSSSGFVTPFERVKLTKVTTSGRVRSTAISGDGHYVVYATNSGGQEALWLKQLATGADIQVTPPEEIVHQALTFSPDSSSFYYVNRARNAVGALFQMPLLGGVAKRIVIDVDSAISFSADGQQISFFRGYPDKNESYLVIANADGSDVKEIAVQKRPNFFPTLLDASPAWSPNDANIVCPWGSRDMHDRYMTLVDVRPENGTILPITSQRWWHIGKIAWLRDASGLVMTAKERSSDPSQIWYVSYPGGLARRITNDLVNYTDISLSRSDPGVLVAVQSHVLSTIMITSHEGKATTVDIGSIDGVGGISWTPDGQIVYAARFNDSQDLFIMDQDGSNQRQLTAHAKDNNWPSVSPDGRYIVFMSNRGGTNQIWRMNLHGSNLKLLTTMGDCRWPRVTPDGEVVVYACLSDPIGLFKVSMDGGASVRLTDKMPTFPAISPDGQRIATGYFEDPEGRTAIYSINGGSPLQILNFSSFFISWTPDGRNLSNIESHAIPNIFIQSFTGDRQQLTDFTDGNIVSFDWASDGKLACSRKVTTSDAVILSSTE